MTTTLDPRPSTPDSRLPTADSPPPLAPDSRPLTPDLRRLPPSERDVEIYQWVQVEGVSTREAGARRCISQTRVRQIVGRVAEWLAEALPQQAEVEREKEVRLAQHVAADRLQFVYQELQTQWKETRDPKFARQATRTVVALARLGVLPGRIDTLLADALLAAGGQSSGVGVPPAEFGATATQQRMAGETPAPQDEELAAPPVEDCSREDEQPADQAPGAEFDIAASGRGAIDCDEEFESEIAGIERQLEAHSPLLSSRQHLPVTQLCISPDQIQQPSHG